MLSTSFAVNLGLRRTLRATSLFVSRTSLERTSRLPKSACLIFWRTDRVVSVWSTPPGAPVRQRKPFEEIIEWNVRFEGQKFLDNRVFCLFDRFVGFRDRISVFFPAKNSVSISCAMRRNCGVMPGLRRMLEIGVLEDRTLLSAIISADRPARRKRGFR